MTYMLEFLVDNIFVVLGEKVFEQMVEIPMGTVVERIIPHSRMSPISLCSNSTPRIIVYIAVPLPRTIYYIVNYPGGKTAL